MSLTNMVLYIFVVILIFLQNFVFTKKNLRKSEFPGHSRTLYRISKHF